MESTNRSHPIPPPLITFPKNKYFSLGVFCFGGCWRGHFSYFHLQTICLNHFLQKKTTNHIENAPAGEVFRSRLASSPPKTKHPKWEINALAGELFGCECVTLWKTHSSWIVWKWICGKHIHLELFECEFVENAFMLNCLKVNLCKNKNIFTLITPLLCERWLVEAAQNESCHTYEWVMSHVWMSHVTHMNESCHTYEWMINSSP